jgi:hypothetical protein
MYNGGPVCEPWLHNETVFVDVSYGQDNINFVVEKLLAFDETAVGPLCTVMLKESVCRYFFPNCTITENGYIERARMCYRGCATLMNHCGHTLLYIIAFVQGKFRTLWDSFKPVHVNLDDLACSRELLASNEKLSCLTLKERIDEVKLSTCKPAATNSHCLFPFTDSGVEYDGCIFVNNSDSWQPWCVTKQRTAVESGKWGHCHCSNNSSTACELSHKDNSTENCANIPTDVLSVSGSDSDNENILISVVVPIGCILAIGLCIIVLLWKRRKTEGIKSVEQLEMYVDVGEDPFKACTEIQWDDDIAYAILETLINGKRLKLAEKIGEGNFGRVFKGTLDESTVVAVKSLKSGKQGSIDHETANCFVREALRMRQLDHPHVMKLVGICWATEVQFLYDSLAECLSGPLIVLPYTELGDLRGYLREKRSVTSSNGNPYIVISNVSADTIDSDQSSIDGKDEKVEDNPIPIAELVKFAFQVATGMDYVSRQGIVHRDLATRNCMLTWDMNVKVSDFGLARMLEEGKDYYRMGHGCALPIRWMAPESISDFLFTTESDVWSYGVTMWEIFSFATIPYAGLSNVDILPHIQNGKRLTKPKLCSDNIYDVMQDCWRMNAKSRPDFSKIASTLEQNLSRQKSYLELQPDLQS